MVFIVLLAIVFLLIPISSIVLLFVNVKPWYINFILNILLIANTIVFLYPAAIEFTHEGTSSTGAPWLYILLLPLCGVIQITLVILKINGYNKLKSISNTKNHVSEIIDDPDLKNNQDQSISVSEPIPNYKWTLFLGIFAVVFYWGGLISLIPGIFAFIQSIKGKNLYLKNPNLYTRTVYNSFIASIKLGIIAICIFIVKNLFFILKMS